MTKQQQAEAAVGLATAALSVDELAVYFRISRTSVYRLFNAGDLKPIKIGRRTAIRRVDADAFLARCAGAVR
ncbi:helix-turn-helix domain-containing protein [Methylobacterium sp. C25]|uniref:helix-turn-helix domain-containing protein n=1 Tax=Methylobacterium sp. C25 TaxID=2721622 RepID=UPI001F25A9B5|nr:helix-turn-helix domain-containing protein [Methylobacterium sp. C25]MCE4226749.1 helix-turn-helix domain-containing protein [Methylobacterium sp. C25]